MKTSLNLTNKTKEMLSQKRKKSKKSLSSFESTSNNNISYINESISSSNDLIDLDLISISTNTKNQLQNQQKNQQKPIKKYKKRTENIKKYSKVVYKKTKSDVYKAFELLKSYNGDYRRVSIEMSSFSEEELKVIYKEKLKKLNKKKTFTPDEDRILLDLIEKNGLCFEKSIEQVFQGKTVTDLKKRYIKLSTLNNIIPINQLNNSDHSCCYSNKTNKNHMEIRNTHENNQSDSILLEENNSNDIHVNILNKTGKEWRKILELQYFNSILHKENNENQKENHNHNKSIVSNRNISKLIHYKENLYDIINNYPLDSAISILNTILYDKELPITDFKTNTKTEILSERSINHEIEKEIKEVFMKNTVFSCNNHLNTDSFNDYDYDFMDDLFNKSINCLSVKDRGLVIDSNHDEFNYYTNFDSKVKSKAEGRFDCNYQSILSNISKVFDNILTIYEKNNDTFIRIISSIIYEDIKVKSTSAMEVTNTIVLDIKRKYNEKTSRLTSKLNDEPREEKEMTEINKEIYKIFDIVICLICLIKIQVLWINIMKEINEISKTST